MSITNATISQRAKKWLEDDRIFIDTETTGLGDDAEIVEICLIDSAGFIMLNTLVKPTKPIPAEATAIHGITDEMVMYAPTWKDIHGAVASLFLSMALLFITPITTQDLYIKLRNYMGLRMTAFVIF